MPHPTRLLAVFCAAVMIPVAFEPLPALSQSLLSQEENLIGDAESDNTDDEIELNGLRGRIDPELEDDLADRSRRGEEDSNKDEAREARENGEDEETQSRRAADTIDSLATPVHALPGDASLESGAGQLGEQSFAEQAREDDPYEALGIRVGSFLLFPELLTQSVYTDNVFLTSEDPDADWALELTPSLRIASDWNRHSLVGRIGGIYSFHDRFPDENDETFNAGVEGRLDVRRSTNLRAAANYSEAFEDRSSTDFPANAAERPRMRTQDALLEGNHTFNRLTLTLRGERAEEDFDDSTQADGTIINNDDRDYTEHRLVGRASYEFQPGVSAFVESSTNDRDFAEAVDDDGTRNGSYGYDIQGGLAFQLTGKLTGEASAGYAIQKPDEESLKDVNGLIFNAALEWRATGLTTIRLNANSEVEETTNSGSAGSLVRESEISIEHRPRRHIILGASLGYEEETFAGSKQVDEEWAFGLTGEYIFTRTVALTIDYEHQKNWSNSGSGDYSVDEVRMGVRVRR